MQQELVFKKTNIAKKLDLLNGKTTNEICFVNL